MKIIINKQDLNYINLIFGNQIKVSKEKIIKFKDWIALQKGRRSYSSRESVAGWKRAIDRHTKLVDRKEKLLEKLNKTMEKK
jgi:hypothetical protein